MDARCRTTTLTGLALAVGVLSVPAGGLRAAADPATPEVPGLTVLHEIPSDVTVQAFVTPEGRRLRFLVRAPLEAMRDIEFPQYGLGYLDLEAAGPFLRDAAQLWLADYVTFHEEDRRLGTPRIVATRVSLPSDRSFATYETALAHFDDPPLDPGLQLPWRQALLDVLLEYEIESDQSRFSIDPAFAHLGLRTVTVLRLRPPDRPERAFQYVGDPGLVRLDPRWHQAALRFVSLGFTHILDGIDHLLFLLCLVIPLRTLWGLVPVITSFTIAHSITLIASAFGIAPRALWFPPLIETLIALSIVYMALENIVGGSRASGGCSRSGSGSCTASASRSHSASRFSSPAGTCSPLCSPSTWEWNWDNCSSWPSPCPWSNCCSGRWWRSGWGRSSRRRCSRTQGGTG